MQVKLRMTGRQHAALRDHLLPGDGLEAAAALLCGRRRGADSHVLTVQRLELVPHDACLRQANRVTWPTQSLLPLLEDASAHDLAVVKVHSHPGGSGQFSATDDLADREFFASVYGWTDTESPHGSALMLPDGTMTGRTLDCDGHFAPIALMTVAGDDLLFFPSDADCDGDTNIGFTRRHGQAFGTGTVKLLRRLVAAVVGCSGTGSVVIEQLVRLGVGTLLLVDPDTVEEVNLNRILNATCADLGRPKVEVAADSVRRMGLGTRVVSIARNLAETASVLAVAGCDVVFGCMDGAEGRHLLNRLCAFYCLPYFDVGVRLEADGNGGISQICGGVNYLQPDGSSLLSRGVITMEAVRAESLKRLNPHVFAREREQNYIIGVNEDRPAVISVNMHYASLAVLELLARIHPYRDEGNSKFARHGSTLTGGAWISEPDGPPCDALAAHVGRGDTVPLLGIPSLREFTRPGAASEP